MADVAKYLKDIQEAIYGEEVRSSIYSAINEINKENAEYDSVKKSLEKLLETTTTDSAELKALLDQVTDIINNGNDLTALLAAINTVENSKADVSHVHSAADIATGILPITRGGTNATTAPDARAALGITELLTPIVTIYDTGTVIKFPVSGIMIVTQRVQVSNLPCTYQWGQIYTSNSAALALPDYPEAFKTVWGNSVTPYGENWDFWLITYNKGIIQTTTNVGTYQAARGLPDTIGTAGIQAITIGLYK